MEKKVVRWLLPIMIFILISIGLAVAANETNVSNTTTNSGSSNDDVSKGYQCLESLVKNNTKLSLQEAIFVSLALGNNKAAVDAIESEKGQNCWPKAGCKLKETSQALLAYNRISKNTEEIESWILSKNATTTDLIWYLEMDISNHVPSECTIRYDNRENKISIGEDMRLSGNGGSCLSIATSGYWLRISDNCINKEFEISCNQDFITSLLYQKRSGETIYVTSETHSASSLGTTKEKVEAYCFKTTNVCDYEGSLWAALALSKSGNQIDKFLPYLLALSDENKKFFPSSFIHILTGGEDQYSQVVQSQKQNKFWEIIGSPYNRYYDTSLGMLSLQGTSAGELENAKNYLLEIQGNDGCWNNKNIRDTAFILYSGWPKSVGSGGGGSTTGGESSRRCEANLNFACAKASECIEAGGTIDYSYDCDSFSQFCCTVKPQVQTCSEKLGTICASNQQCSGTSISSADGSCCLGTCQEVSTENVCEVVSGGTCRSSCDSELEEEVSSSCSISSDVCCVAKTESEEKGFGWLWIIILIILIALVAIGIIYRDKLRLWWFGFRGRFKSSPVKKDYGFSPGGPAPRAPPRFGPGGFPGNYRPIPSRQIPSRPVNRPAPPVRPSRPASKGNEDDKEMEETLKKLREMSK